MLYCVRQGHVELRDGRDGWKMYYDLACGTMASHTIRGLMRRLYVQLDADGIVEMTQDGREALARFEAQK